MKTKVIFVSVSRSLTLGFVKTCEQVNYKQKQMIKGYQFWTVINSETKWQKKLKTITGGHTNRPDVSRPSLSNETNNRLRSFYGLSCQKPITSCLFFLEKDHGCVYRTRTASLPWIEQATATSGDSMLSSDWEQKVHAPTWRSITLFLICKANS